VAVLNLTINDRVYEVGCEDGQTEQVRALADDVDARVRQLSRQLGTQPEGRLLVMAALMLADELSEARGALERAQAEVAAAADGDSRLAEGIGNMAERIESIAERLERS
jgi:cell division protein ZapA